MGYYIDLEKITIDDYQVKLETAYLPPSRMILKDSIDLRFEYFKSIGLRNVKELIQLLKRKDKFMELSKSDCLSIEYLTILLRELNSNLPKPNKISEFTNVSSESIQKLIRIGIINTEKIYDKILTKSDRQKLADLSGVEYQDILKLSKLADLSRIKWVGATYAQILYDLGVDNVEKVSKSDVVDLHQRINEIIKEQNLFKGAIGLNDVKILVTVAGELSLDFEYE